MKGGDEHHNDEQQHSDTQVVSLLGDGNRRMCVQRVNAATKNGAEESTKSKSTGRL